LRTIAAVFATAICLVGELNVVHASEVHYKLLPNFEVAVGAKFPLNGLSDPEGSVIAKERFLGKVLLINFYTKNCTPCIKEVPKLNKIKMQRGDINVLAITPDTSEQAAIYIKQYSLNWQVAANAETLLFKDLKVLAFPAFALLDTTGHLVATVQANQLGGEDGHATVEGIEAWVDEQIRKTIK
jgi:peroxiredoxin